MQNISDAAQFPVYATAKLTNLNDNQRQKCIDTANLSKVVAGIAIGFFAVAAAGFLALSLSAAPITGILLAASSGLLSFAGYEAFVVAKNVENFFRKNLVNQLLGITSAETFTNELTRGSIVTGPLFRSLIADQLNKEANRSR